MKIFLILFIFSLSFISCSDDSSADLPLTIRPENVEGIILSPTWKITLYMDGDSDETGDFYGYEFNFEKDSTVIATLNSQKKQGTWITYKDNNVVKLNLNFGDQDPLDKITEDWVITLLTVQKIELEDVNSGGESIDKLAFQKK